MESPPSTPELATSQHPNPDNPISKRRKMAHKTVVTVKVEEKTGKQKGDGPPSDQWSWRKYGQKPIKGSPYPRGYYRCSTAKGCSAKKQVERSRADASVLIITYTSTHNHPDPPDAAAPQLKQTHSPPPPPSLSSSFQRTEDDLPSPTTGPDPITAARDGARSKSEGTSSHQPQPPPSKGLEDSIESDKLPEEEEEGGGGRPTVALALGEDGPFIPSPQIGALTKTATATTTPTGPLSEEDDDFFDELGELPMSSSSFTSLMRSSSFDIIPIS